MNPQDGYNQDSLTMNGHANGENHRQDRSKNEDRKIFVGGIPYDVTDQDLISHFSQFGNVASANVKFDRATGRSRGFAFVEFGSVEACQDALQKREQTIKNKTVEVKPAKSHENKKVFIGGIPADLTEDELRTHFSSFGKVEEIEWPTDKLTKQHRNFAFIVFEEEASADIAATNQKHQIRDRECDVKKAVPRSRRMNQFPHAGPPMGGYGGQMGAQMQHQQQWFNPSQWGQMGMPYGAAPGGWGDWYGGGMPNYYSQGTGQTGAPAGGPGGNPGNYGGQHNNFKQNRPRVFSGFDGQHANNQH